MKASHRRAKLEARRKDFDDRAAGKSGWARVDEKTIRKNGGDANGTTWHRPGSQK